MVLLGVVFGSTTTGEMAGSDMQPVNARQPVSARQPPISHPAYRDRACPEPLRGDSRLVDMDWSLLRQASWRAGLFVKLRQASSGGGQILPACFIIQKAIQTSVLSKDVYFLLKC